MSSVEEQPLLEENVETHKRPSPYHATVPIVIAVFSVSLSVVALQQWLLLYLCSNYSDSKEIMPGLFHSVLISKPADWDTCRQNQVVQQMTAKWNMALTLFTSIPALLTGPFWGALSDRIGRRPLFMVVPVAVILNCVGIMITDYFAVGLWLLLVIHVVQGLLGSYYVGIVTLLSYFTDTTTPQERSHVFVVGEAIIFLSFAFGPYVGGILTRVLPRGVSDVFIVTMIGEILAFLYALLFLPESLEKSKRKDTKPKTLREMVIDIKNLLGEINTSLFLVILILTFIAGIMPSKGLFFYYAALRLGWDALDEGQYMLFGSGIRIFYMVAVFPLLTRAFTNRRKHSKGRAQFDIWLTRISIFFAALGPFIMAQVTTTAGVYSVSAIEGVAILAVPTMRTMLSIAAKDQTAQMFASVNFLEQMAAIISGLVFPMIWSNTLGSLPGAFLYVAGILFLLAFGLTLFIRVDQVTEPELEE
ncbi:major facilitator superfamily domain-containing protein [Gorgonomyces haynaldii]|nr:major facilitator superfamily domain-containing protein [Gorgonomyces haynaldii]